MRLPLLPLALLLALAHAKPPKSRRKELRAEVERLLKQTAGVDAADPTNIDGHLPFQSLGIIHAGAFTAIGLAAPAPTSP